MADTFASYLKNKNFHWNVSAPHFRDYHLLSDEQAAEILAITDGLAERVSKIGAGTLRSIGNISRHGRVTLEIGSERGAENLLDAFADFFLRH